MKQPGLQISQVLLLRAHFEHREDALAFTPATHLSNLPVQFDAKVGGKMGDESVVLRLRAYTPEDAETLYKFDIEIAAIVSRVLGEENLEPFDYAMNIGTAAFFPFLREAVAGITMRGRFGALWLAPVNFLATAQKGNATEVESSGVET